MMTEHQQPTMHLRVMSFNIWNSGGHVRHGFDKIVEHLKRVRPDIVCLQELEGGTLQKLLNHLGPDWKGVQMQNRTWTTAILTVHELNPKVLCETDAFLGTQVLIRCQSDIARLNVWSAYLDWQHFATYYACDLSLPNWCEKLKEYRGRMQQFECLMQQTEFANQLIDADEIPILIAGDFNEPSHLDWSEMFSQLHQGRSYEFELSKAFELAGFLDSFRFCHSNAIELPGTTWSTVYKNSSESGTWRGSEPQERIDFVYVCGKKLQPLNSWVYHGSEPIFEVPDHKYNHWPSDHSAVICSFSLSIDITPIQELVLEEK